MECNGFCSICPNPCFRGEIKGKLEEISPISPTEEEKASEIFDSAVPPTETGLSVVEDVGSYEVRKNIFGKEKVVRIK